MGTVFSLSATIFQQPIAEISHVVGRKPAFLAVLGVFAIGSIAAATAKDMTTLLVGRSMQGFASGGSVLAAIVLTDLVDLRDRATWLSVQNSVQAVGLVTGPLIGASLLKATSWRWLFWINLPAIAASAAGLGVLLGFDRPAEGIWVTLRKVDWVGILIFMPSAVALLVTFTMAGIFFAWKSWQAIMSLLLGIGGLATLAVHQRYLAKNPMFRSSLFAKWTTTCSFFGQAVFGVCINMIFYYLVVFWSGVRGFDEILTGVALLPETLSIPVAAIVCGLTMRKTGRICWAMLVGWPLTSLSIGLLWFLDTKTPLAALIVINTGVGLGAGIIASALNVAILATTTREDNGHAMAMGWLFKSAGMCLGIAIGTAVFSVQMESRLRQMDEPEMTAESLLRVLKNVKNDLAGQEAIVRTLRILWTICCGLSGLAGLLCGSCKYPTLNDRMQAQGDGAVKDVESGSSSNCSSATQAKHPQHHITAVDHGLPQTGLKS
ncbi:major facilitator superfamily-domain-containing protein [Lasiosphaeria miniovina]|uniref:Major facilitator superfamily-domain-containing protein n=1 Tax=Lasiosphaeria miniovina TaxID=1954250 RepID=A0AA40DNA2_9PEZI|nr:major facilitator superfamily-domain-containing protein [Lasiosphaeria miniovina]KAK0709460.1 major facilitator superfamily-domain-containing protein [Lasiosphaeria miniovina]